MKLTNAISKRIKERLKEQNMTQYELFKRTGVPQSTISMILNNKVNSILISTIYQLCIGLDLEMSEFFNKPYLKLENIED